MATLSFSRPLILVAHPDDETIACGGLLQRMAESLVVFATDGAPPKYGFERKYGSLEQYALERFREADRALMHVRTARFSRLSNKDGSFFVDQHLFRHLKDAAKALSEVIAEFTPDAIVSHAYEGGHIDHDACGFLASRSSQAVGVRCFEFPLYSPLTGSQHEY